MYLPCLSITGIQRLNRHPDDLKEQVQFLVATFGQDCQNRKIVEATGVSSASRRQKRLAARCGVLQQLHRLKQLRAPE